MRAILIAVSVLCSAAAAQASGCNSGSGEILKVKDWTASAQNERSTNVSFTLENATKKKVQMVDGTVWFEDALGQSIGGISIEPDTILAPGETLEQANFMAGFDRLVKARKTDINAVSCLVSVLYEDGTKEEFK